MGPGFDPARLIGRLERFEPVLPGVVQVFSSEDARWKPDESSWSILEIVCHLVDEEVEDFRTRVLSTLEDPARPWPAIDPQGWAERRGYQSQNLHAKVIEFVELRGESITLLREVTSPDWSRVYKHPIIGDISAADMLSNWCAHDALHLRQISRRLHQLAQRDSGGASLDYAGTW